GPKTAWVGVGAGAAVSHRREAIKKRLVQEALSLRLRAAAQLYCAQSLHKPMRQTYGASSIAGHCCNTRIRCRWSAAKRQAVSMSEELLPYDYLHRAGLFYRAFCDLPEPGDPLWDWPRYFMLCHAIELALKAYLAYRGATYRQLKDDF